MNRALILIRTFAGIVAVACCGYVRAQVARGVIAHPAGAYANVNGVKLWYEIEGQGEPLVLISGGPGDSHSVFHLFFSSLANRNQVIYFDPLGVGKSDPAKTAREYSFARDVENLEGLRKALGLVAWNVLGQSYGGMVAQAYALKYPQVVKRLILIDTFYSGKMWQANDDNCNREIQTQYPEAWAELQSLRRRGLRSNSLEHQQVYGSIPLGLFFFRDASKAALLPSEAGNNMIYYTVAGDDADFKIGGDIAALDFRGELKKLMMPMLILAGRFDRVSTPRDAIKYKRYAPRASFVMFEESGHFPYVEEPAKSLAVLQEFLGQ